MPTFDSAQRIIKTQHFYTHTKDGKNCIEQLSLKLTGRVDRTQTARESQLSAKVENHARKRDSAFRRWIYCARCVIWYDCSIHQRKLLLSGMITQKHCVIWCDNSWHQRELLLSGMITHYSNKNYCVIWYEITQHIKENNYCVILTTLRHQRDSR